jgi:hypothetical protein
MGTASDCCQGLEQWSLFLFSVGLTVERGKSDGAGVVIFVSN